jgi:hypothetical protein
MAWNQLKKKKEKTRVIGFFESENPGLAWCLPRVSQSKKRYEDPCTYNRTYREKDVPRCATRSKCAECHSPQDVSPAAPVPRIYLLQELNHENLLKLVDFLPPATPDFKDFCGSVSDSL